MTVRVVTAASLVLLACAPVVAADAPAPAAGVGVDEHVGEVLPLDVDVTDQRGRHAALGEFLGGDAPVVLSLAYYHCPGLCDVSLRELAARLRDLGWQLGSDYRALTISIDPHDTPPTAAAKRANVMNLLHASASQHWPFLVARADVIARLTRQLGYRYTYDTATHQFAHPAVSVILTPRGQVSRYLYGPTYPVGSLRLALREARSGRGGASALIDRTVLSCFRYDPAAHRYQWLIAGVMRIGAAAIALLLAAAIAFFTHRDRVRRSQL